MARPEIVRPAPTAATRVVAVIGDPVAHSLSPVIHNAAFTKLGLDWVYVALPVPRGHGIEAVRALHALKLAGLNVTAPHKEAAADACDELTEDATALRSVNTVVARSDGSLLGDSTDGEGFVRALDDEGVECSGRNVLVVGAGGAARAVTLALARRGAHLVVAARRMDRAEAAASLAPGGVAVAMEDVPAVLGEVSLVVHATPVGMAGEPPPFDTGPLGAGHIVVDLVYGPTDTGLLVTARAAGARGIGGLGMLVHQAACSFTAWTGLEAPLDVMQESVRPH